VKDIDLRWALRRAGIWCLFLVVQYCIVAGFAWWWVLGLNFPLWKVLVIAVIQAFCSFIGAAIFPAAKKEKREDEEHKKGEGK
jgi:hypothetical protein